VGGLFAEVFERVLHFQEHCPSVFKRLCHSSDIGHNRGSRKQHSNHHCGKKASCYRERNSPEPFDTQPGMAEPTSIPHIAVHCSSNTALSLALLLRVRSSMGRSQARTPLPDQGPRMTLDPNLGLPIAMQPASAPGLDKTGAESDL
jgi:hypothetical protein